MLNISILSSEREGIFFPLQIGDGEVTKKTGAYRVKVRIDARLSRKNIRIEFEGTFIYRRNMFDTDENNPGASLVNYPLEVQRMMKIHEDGGMDLIIIEFGWLQGDSL